MLKRVKSFFSPTPKIVYEIELSPEGTYNGFVFLVVSIPGVVDDAILLSELADQIISEEAGTVAVISGVLNISKMVDRIEATTEGRSKFIHDPFRQDNETISLLVPGKSRDRLQIFHEIFEGYFRGELTFIGLLGLVNEIGLDQIALEEISGILQSIGEWEYDPNEKLAEFQEKVEKNFDRYYSDRRVESFLSSGADEHYLWFYLKNTSEEKLLKIFNSAAEKYGLPIST